jgi:hypothetical protein
MLLVAGNINLSVSQNTYLFISFISMLLTMVSTSILIYRNVKNADKKTLSDFERKALSAIRDLKNDVADVKKDVWDTTVRLENHIDKAGGEEVPVKTLAKKPAKRIAKKVAPKND